MRITTVNVKNTTRRGAALIVAGAAAGALGVAGAGEAQAAPPVAYSPTATVVPGACGALINATKLDGDSPSSFKVRVDVQRFGINCGTFHFGVSWRNATTGATGGQVHTLTPDGKIDGSTSRILTGFGYGPGKGRVVSTIDTYSSYDEAAITPLPHIAGRAVFTLG